MKNTTTTTRLLVLLAVGALASCSDNDPATSGSAGGDNAESATDSTAADARIDSVWLGAEPEGAASVIETRASAEPGTPVTVTGRIAGALNPFTEGYATFVLADHTLETCDLTEDDECPTPWDACCADPATIKASRLSVQIPGDDGRPVPQSLKGAGGLAELDEVAVTGTIAEGSTPDNVIIDATGIYRKE
ncbi:hypothetical protein BH23VER1_BH23VER1_28100 [soil metagenome]